MNTLHLWWSNFTSLFTRKIEPEDLLEEQIFTLEKQLISLRQSLAQGASSLRKNEKLEADYRTVSKHWYRQAKVNLYCHKVVAAREALANQRELHQLGHQICQQMKKQRSMMAAIKDDIEKLEAKITDIKSYRAYFNNRSRTAEVNQRFYQQLQGSGINEVIARWEDQARDAEILDGWEESLNNYWDKKMESMEPPMLNNIQQWLEAEPPEIKDVNIDQELENLKKDLDKIN
jgi:phage shock protein A